LLKTDFVTSFGIDGFFRGVKTMAIYTSQR